MTQDSRRRVQADAPCDLFWQRRVQFQTVLTAKPLNASPCFLGRPFSTDDTRTKVDLPLPFPSSSPLGAADASSTLETLRFAAVAQQIKCLPPVYPMAPPQPRAAAAKRNRLRRSESAASDSQRSSNGSSAHAATDVFTLQEQARRGFGELGR
eukprot:6196239-Pleurochrysis_carterae.AAC.5